MTDGDRLEGLRAAVELSPDNHALRLVLAESLREAGETGDALTEFERVLDAGALPRDEAIQVGTDAAHAGRLQLAARCLELARNSGVIGGTAGLEDLLTALLADSGAVRRIDGPEPDDSVTRRVSVAEEARTFADVGGLDDVKQAIHRTIVLPYQRPDLFEHYGRRAGGGVLLFGPPGCGKTLLARATAGECGAPFLNLRIEDVLAPYFGVSEQRLHQGFDEARASAPCVLFLDEIDTLAYARRNQRGAGVGRAMVDQLLQELDAIGADNRGLLVLGATNVPWDVDDALQRPGRFDRVVFVPPPDTEARRRVLEIALRDRPSVGIDLDALAERTPMFSGADLCAVIERAVDAAIDEALTSGHEVPITQRHIEVAMRSARATTLDWLRTARNYTEFANEGGRYDEVRAYLDQREMRKLLRR
ncbi:MAG: AAA family ATPase [Solirubrobacteraceae bacterium]|nr:AAA family ATPase [Solirubrobacteraceae bacterium]